MMNDELKHVLIYTDGGGPNPTQAPGAMAWC